jgi:peptide-methionine (S)-S-oxide reductase
MWQILRKKAEMPTADRALPGRDKPGFAVPATHFVNGNRIQPPFPAGLEQAMFGLGCFWGAERKFWETPGIYATAAGYAAGFTPNPTYEEVCSGYTGHNEVVKVWFDPKKTSYEALLKVFWENHDPTQGMRQGNDVGSEYRSVIFARDDAQRAAAEASKAMFQKQLSAAGYGEITTEIVGPPAPPFYLAEEYHQQYLDKVPNGYCPNHATGVKLPDDFVVTPLQYVD